MIRIRRDNAGNVNISHVNHEHLNLMKVLADVLAHRPIDISYAELVSKAGCDDDTACKAIGEYIGEHSKSARPDDRELLEDFGTWAVEWHKQFEQEPDRAGSDPGADFENAAVAAERQATLTEHERAAEAVQEEEQRNLPGPHRHEESWEQYFRRRVEDEPDAPYLSRHQKAEDRIREYSDPETGTLSVCGYLARDSSGRHEYYLDSRGRKFKVDEWDCHDRTTEPLVMMTPYVLQHPRISSRPNLGTWNVSLTQKLSEFDCIARGGWGELIDVTAIPSLEALVGKRVRVSCTVNFIRENYYYDDGCYDRVHLVPTGTEAVEVDVLGESVEDQEKNRRNPAE